MVQWSKQGIILLAAALFAWFNFSRMQQASTPANPASAVPDNQWLRVKRVVVQSINMFEHDAVDGIDNLGRRQYVILSRNPVQVRLQVIETKKNHPMQLNREKRKRGARASYRKRSLATDMQNHARGPQVVQPPIQLEIGVFDDKPDVLRVSELLKAAGVVNRFFGTGVEVPGEHPTRGTPAEPRQNEQQAKDSTTTTNTIDQALHDTAIPKVSHAHAAPIVSPSERPTDEHEVTAAGPSGS